MNRLALFWFGHWFPIVPMAILFVLVIVLSVVLMWGRRDTSTTPAALADLVADIAAGRPEAVNQAKAVAARDWPAAAPAVSAMLADDDARVRAAACLIFADHLDGNGVAAVFPRAGDTDWRVRLAAFQVLSAAQPLAGEVLRDTPLDEREALLLHWLDARDTSARGESEGGMATLLRGHAPETEKTAAPALRPAAPLGPDLCELYAADRHVEFGRPLAARCLACHAGAEPAPFGASETCAGCHAANHADWAESAHAQSLSHLHLATINSDTRQPEQMTFGEVRGIGCRECHRVEKEPAEAAGWHGHAPLRDHVAETSAVMVTQNRVTMPPVAGEPAACPFRFRSDAKPADSCRRCHGSTAAEWQAWLKGPQPRVATWPPGQIEMDRRGDARTCVDCHMPPDAAGGDKPGRAHTWSARRDVQRLRGGLSAALAVTRGTAAPTLSLTNLAGHAYPTGTRRRALRILAGPAGDGAQAIAADLSPVRPGRPLAVALPALAPGERRALPLSVLPGAPAIVCRLLYCRDVSDPQASVAEIWQAEQDVRPWTGPQGADPAKLKTD